MTRLTDLIKLAGIELKGFKVHLATCTKMSPLSRFYDGTFENWQERQWKRNFDCKQIIGLIRMARDLADRRV